MTISRKCVVLMMCFLLKFSKIIEPVKNECYFQDIYINNIKNGEKRNFTRKTRTCLVSWITTIGFQRRRNISFFTLCFPTSVQYWYKVIISVFPVNLYLNYFNDQTINYVPMFIIKWLGSSLHYIHGLLRINFFVKWMLPLSNILLFYQMLCDTTWT